MSAGRLLRVLGPTLIEHADERRPVRGLAGEIACLLASRYPASVPSDLIAEALWPDRPPRESRAGLRVALHGLRQRLGGPDTVVHENEGYRLALAPDEIDQIRFQAVARDPEAATAESLGTALELWRGRAYESFADQELLRSAGAHLDALRLDTEEKHIDALLDEGQTDIAATAASQLVDDQPYRERRWELLMLALYRCGRQSEALTVASRARSRLRDDLGVNPGPALAQLEVAILNHDPSLQTPAAPTAQAPAATTGGLGDLVAGLRELKAGPPRITTSFIGRDDEVERIGELLDSHDCVTVVGPPGAGKTRLASRLCGGLGDQRVVWVDLVGVDLETLVEELAGRLGLVGAGAIEVVTALRRMPTVIVFDNAEHIVAPVAELVEALLPACDELTILVTSRHRLGVGSETVVDLGPLEPAAAAVLLGQRAFGDVDPSRRPSIEELTRAVERLDCFPLHIELLAPLLRERSIPEALQLVTAAQGTSVDGERHANLAAAVAWSIRVLSDPAKQLHAALGVFEGSFEADDVAAVVRLADTSGVIAELVRHSLVQVEWSHATPLYRQAAGVREHARSLLDASGQLVALEAAHTAHFCALAGVLGDDVMGPNEGAATERLRRAIPQLDLARRRSLTTGDLAGAADMALSLWQCAVLALDYPRYRWLLDLVDEPGVEELDRAPELFAAAAMTAWAASDPDLADRLSDEARKLSMSRAVDVPIPALLATANAASYSEDLQWMTASFIELWSSTEAYGDRRDRATVASMMTLGHVQLGNVGAAAGSAKMAMGHASEIDNPSSLAWAIFAVGWAELLDDPTAATRSFLASVRLSRSAGSRWLEGLAISAMVTASLHRERFDEACQLLPNVLEHWGRTRSIPQLARSSREAVIALHDAGRSDLAAQVLGYAELLSPVHPLLDSDQRRFDEIVAALAGVRRSDLASIDPAQCWPSIVAVFDSY